MPDLEEHLAKLNDMFDILEDLKKSLTTEFSTYHRAIWSEGLKFIEVGMNVKSSEKSKKINGVKHETINDAYHNNLYVLEYKICTLI